MIEPRETIFFLHWQIDMRQEELGGSTLLDEIPCFIMDHQSWQMDARVVIRKPIFRHFLRSLGRSAIPRPTR